MDKTIAMQNRKVEENNWWLAGGKKRKKKQQQQHLTNLRKQERKELRLLTCL
jgi:hypothetical protein